MWTSIDDDGLQIAIEQAKKSYEEGGVPIGAAILIRTRFKSEPDAEEVKRSNFEVLGRGHNKQIQQSSAILHAEMDALENAGRLRAEIYGNATMYTTLSPCSMCTGAILHYKIPRVVIGAQKKLSGGEEQLRQNGVEVLVKDVEECKELTRSFFRESVGSRGNAY